MSHQRTWLHFITIPLIVLSLGLVHAPQAAAQKDAVLYLQLLRTDILTDKIAILTDAMAFTPEQAETFWPIYRDYQISKLKARGAEILLLNPLGARSQRPRTRPRASSPPSRSGCVWRTMGHS